MKEKKWKRWIDLDRFFEPSTITRYEFGLGVITNRCPVFAKSVKATRRFKPRAQRPGPVKYLVKDGVEVNDEKG
jgi:hypothetical protein